jgi:hypothetical protein
MPVITQALTQTPLPDRVSQLRPIDRRATELDRLVEPPEILSEVEAWRR